MNVFAAISSVPRAHEGPMCGAFFPSILKTAWDDYLFKGSPSTDEREQMPAEEAQKYPNQGGKKGGRGENRPSQMGWQIRGAGKEKITSRCLNALTREQCIVGTLAASGNAYSVLKQKDRDGSLRGATVRTHTQRFGAEQYIHSPQFTPTCSVILTRWPRSLLFQNSIVLSHYV